MQKTISNQDISRREREVLELLSFGQSSHEIAIQLHLSQYTINNQRRSLLAKGQANNLTQLIRNGFEFQLLKTKHQLL